VIDQTGLGKLILALRAGPAPEALFSHASTAKHLIANHEHRGAVLAGHAILMSLARQTDSEPLNASGLAAIAFVLARLADYLETPSQSALDAVGDAWRDWQAPSSLQ
jgi:hypothetical protein